MRAFKIGERIAAVSVESGRDNQEVRREVRQSQ